MSTIIQRSMSERSREKCLRLHIGGGHPIVECSHRVARRMCRHAGAKLRHQARLEYVQSTPNVATMHNGKHTVANPRGGTADVNGSVYHQYTICGNRLRICLHFLFSQRLCTSMCALSRGNAPSFLLLYFGAALLTVSAKFDKPAIFAFGFAGGSAVNVSKMYSAVSDGELLDLTILPIFQKLLTERHKSTARRGYRSNIASCPNISIKCDIVEYL